MNTRFNLDHATATIHYTLRRELHGENPEPAATIAIETTNWHFLGAAAGA